MVYETSLDIKQMAVQGIGSVIGNAAGGAVAAELETSAATNDYYGHEIAEEEAQTNKVIALKVDDPTLNQPDSRKVSYALSEINRKQMERSNANESQVQAQENARLTRMTRWTDKSSANSFEYCPIDSNAYSARETPNHYINGIPKDAIEPIYPELLLWGATDVAKVGIGAIKYLPKVASGIGGLIKNGLWRNTAKAFGKPMEGESVARNAIIEENIARSKMLHEKYGSFTKHSINRTIEREIPPKNILESIKNPLDVGPIKYDQLGRPSQKIIGQTTTFVINPITKSIITTYSTKSSIANKFVKQLNENLEANNFRPR